MGDEAELEARLAEMRQGYARKLLASLGHLRDCAKRARAGDSDALEEAVREAHRLHGTAGSFGFTGISMAMGEVELVLERIASSGTKSLDEWDAVSGRIQGALADASLGAAAVG